MSKVFCLIHQAREAMRWLADTPGAAVVIWGPCVCDLEEE